MHSAKIILAASLTASLAAMLSSCGQPPEASIEENCIRFEQEDGANKAKAEERCSCMAEGLKDAMSEKNLEKIASAFEDAKDGDDLERTLKDEGVSDGLMMSFAGVGKSCAIGEL